MRTANPALNSKTFQDYEVAASGRETMSMQGTVNRTAFLLILLMLPAFWVWNMFFSSESAGAVMPYAIGGAVGGLIVAVITVFKKTWAPATAPLYALLEGAFLGGISAIFEAQYPGIVLQAVFLTFGTLFGLLAAYRSGLIKVTQNFRLGVVAATGGIFLVYMLTWILGFFGVNMPMIHESGIVGIGFSVFVVIIAALNLVLDFDFIESGVEQGAPRYMEWFAAFGLLVTLVWLYVEILRLLAKLNRR